jgi:hypothetical protein
MALLVRIRRRRRMTLWSNIRRQLQAFGPYQSLMLMLVPVLLVEPLKFVALLVAGEGHWLGGTGIILAAYATSLVWRVGWGHRRHFRGGW